MRRWGRGGKTRDEVFIRPVPTVGNELNPLRNLGDDEEHTLEVPRPRTAARSTPHPQWIRATSRARNPALSTGLVSGSGQKIPRAEDPGVCRWRSPEGPWEGPQQHLKQEDGAWVGSRQGQLSSAREELSSERDHE